MEFLMQKENHDMLSSQGLRPEELQPEAPRSTKSFELFTAESIYFLYFSFDKKRVWWVLVVIGWKLTLTIIVNLVPSDYLNLILINFYGLLIFVYIISSPFVFRDLNSIQINLFLLNLILVFSIGLLNSEENEKYLGQIIFYAILLINIFFIFIVIPLKMKSFHKKSKKVLK